MKIYRGVNIGANKEVILNEMMTKNIPIHLIDIVDPTTLFSVADFYSHVYVFPSLLSIHSFFVYPPSLNFIQQSRRITAEILSRGRVPIVVGGTPFYLRWYLRGPQECPKRDPALHARILEELLRENDWEKRFLLLTLSFRLFLVVSYVLSHLQTPLVGVKSLSFACCGSGLCRKSLPRELPSSSTCIGNHNANWTTTDESSSYTTNSSTYVVECPSPPSLLPPFSLLSLFCFVCIK